MENAIQMRPHGGPSAPHQAYEQDFFNVLLATKLPESEADSSKACNGATIGPSRLSTVSARVNPGFSTLSTDLRLSYRPARSGAHGVCMPRGIRPFVDTRKWPPL